MAAEKISIVYVRIDSGIEGGDRTPYHAQLQYFTSSGERKIIEAIPERHPANEPIQTLLWGSTLATSETPWGRLIVKPSSDNLRPDQVTDPQKTLAEGADLSAIWTKFQDGAAKVSAEGYWYNPVQQNSNSFAGQLIIYAGMLRSLTLDPGNPSNGMMTVPGFETGLSFPINSHIPGAGFGGRQTENYDDSGVLRFASATDFDGNVLQNAFAANGALVQRTTPNNLYLTTRRCEMRLRRSGFRPAPGMSCVSQVRRPAKAIPPPLPPASPTHCRRKRYRRCSAKSPG
ncbi:MAG TPA: hypothetical protein VN844_08620 [Pyrinomonadaceae bacterium]|nr:hypothetical protein [Pyrinomonadaceae bacterium]